MIIILTGSTGSGKTDTSWELLKKINNIVFLDCDWFASKVPFCWSNEIDVDKIFESISKMITFNVESDYKNFVVTFTPQMAELYEKYLDHFSKFNMPIYLFRLKCNLQELEKRILKRDRIESQKQQIAGNCSND